MSYSMNRKKSILTFMITNAQKFTHQKLFLIFNIVAFEVLDIFRIHGDWKNKPQNHYFISSFIFIIVVSNNNDRFHLLNIYSVVVILLSSLGTFSHLIFTHSLWGRFYYYPTFKWGNWNTAKVAYPRSSSWRQKSFWIQVFWPQSMFITIKMKR